MPQQSENRIACFYKALVIALLLHLGVSVSWSAEVKDTKFSVDRGFFENPFVLEISTATDGALIRYTTDGSQPTLKNGRNYTGPLILNRTTVLRVAAFKSGFDPTDVDTHSYIFLEDVIRQTGKGMPEDWGELGKFDTVPGDLNPGPYAADYAMDPEVVDDPEYANTIKQDLRSISTLSLSLHPEDLFSTEPVETNVAGNVTQARGIYPIGKGFERAASAELILPDGSTGFQIDCSVEIQGATSTDRWKTDKLSMRLKFKPPYGPSELDYPLFGDDATDSINTVVLDATNQQSWTHPVQSQQLRAQYIRDQFVGDLQNAVGGLAPRGRYAHVYLNGLYWGVYCLHEFVEEQFVSSYRGGKRKDYDILRHRADNVVAGDGVRYADLLRALDADISVNENYVDVLAMLDIDRFIDYILINFYAGNADWAFQNWNASIHRSDPDRPWMFHNWDAEKTFQLANDDVTRADDPGAPTHIHQRLCNNKEYRLKFADRANLLMLNGGVLTPEVVASMYLSRLRQIDRAIVAESARWGDNRNPDQVPYTRTTWLVERDRLAADFFPQRTGIVLSQLRREELYPTLSAPEFSRHGGTVEAGFNLNMENPSGVGQILFTTDGNDPRAEGGAVSDSAMEGEQLSVGRSMRVLARIYNEPDKEWSALTESVFSVAGGLSQLRITEVMYNPPNLSSSERIAGFDDEDDFEYIELRNSGSQDVNLFGVKFIKGIQFTFGSTLLGSGESILVVKDPVAFEERYGVGVFNIAGEFGGSLSNSGEVISLSSRFGNTIQEFKYDDAWYPPTDGEGRSLVAVDFAAPLRDWNLAEGWRSSKFEGGSPGSDETPLPSIRITEIHFHPREPSEKEKLAGFEDGNEFEFLELRNVGKESLRLEGFRISGAVEFIFGPMLLGVGDYVVVAADALAFAERYGEEIKLGGVFESGRLNNSGERIFLYSASGELIHDFRYSSLWHPASNGAGASLITANDFARLFRWRESSQWRSSGVLGGSPGGTDSNGPVSAIRISEIMFNPEPSSEEELLAGLGDNDDFEFIELLNVGSEAENLFGYELSGAVRMRLGDFLLGPGQRVVVVKRSRAFKARYGEELQVIGEYSGNLSNSVEELLLKKPSGDTILKFTYNGNWYGSADGKGRSLTIVDAHAHPVFWGISEGWRPSGASGGTPGAKGDNYFDWVWNQFSDSASMDLSVTGELADPDHDMAVNFVEYALSSDPLSKDGKGYFQSLVEVNGEHFLAITYTSNPAALDTEIDIEFSSDLKTWNPANPRFEPYIHGELEDGTRQITVIDSVPVQKAAHRYMRLVIRH